MSIFEPRNKLRVDFQAKYLIDFGYIFRFLHKKLFSKISADPKTDNNKI